MSSLVTRMLSIIALALIVVVGAAAVVQTKRLQPDRPAAPKPTKPAVTPAREPQNLTERLVVAIKYRRGARALLSTLSVLLLLGAAGVIGWPFMSNLWSERLQGELDNELASPEAQADYRSRSIATGDALTRIQIPSIDVDVVVVEGTTASALRAGAGHYPSTPLPCEIGNVAIAGHRTTYGRPFHDVDLLESGDLIILETPIDRCTYEVGEDPFIVEPTQVEVVDNVDDEAMLTLTSCHPKGSARERIVVQATMVNYEVLDA